MIAAILTLTRFFKQNAPVNKQQEHFYRIK